MKKKTLKATTAFNNNLQLMSVFQKDAYIEEICKHLIRNQLSN